MTSTGTADGPGSADEPGHPPPRSLGALDPEAVSPLGRHSFLRRVVAEPVTAVMIQRALVMDVAHPLVAAGVQDHSSFRRQPWRRAWVTVDAALRLVFGDSPTARGAARQIYATHDHIHGSLPQGAGPWKAGTGYTAHDAELLTWVWATLVDSAAVAYNRWVAPFTDTEADDYYADMVAFARFVGIPAASLPADRWAFAHYLEATIAGDLLGATDEGRSLAHDILWFTHPSVPAPIVRVGRVLALATLDPRLSARLDISLDAHDERYRRRLDARLCRTYPRLPRARASLPALYVALRRPTIGVAARARSVRRRLLG